VRGQESVRAVCVDLRDTGGVGVTWSDGHESRYPLGLLRARCPCATCRGPSKSGGVPHEAPAWPEGSARLVRGVGPVGRYALKFEWADGHDTGIYTYEYLRSLCPCDVCRA